MTAGNTVAEITPMLIGGFCNIDSYLSLGREYPHFINAFFNLVYEKMPDTVWQIELVVL